MPTFERNGTSIYLLLHQFPRCSSASTLQADLSKRVEPRFDVSHVGQAVVDMAQLPLDANVLSMTVMATKMPFVGRS